MTRDENDFRIAPGTSRDSGRGAGRKTARLAAQVKRAATKAGLSRSRRVGLKRGRGTGSRGRGRRALAGMQQVKGQRRVTVMARIVRHKGAHFRAAPLGRHIAYLERDGVTRDGRDASMFDQAGDNADRDIFARNCEEDRHHFRFIVSPEDAPELDDLRTFTRELMADMAMDLGTHLEWVAVDHWNTDNPHVHILLRGVADDGSDLVIDRAYVSSGIRFRAEERATLELGMRSEQQIGAALAREVDAEYWTTLDRTLEARAHEITGLIDLRPDPATHQNIERLLRGRAAKLETLGLATQISSGLWSLDANAQDVLRDLSVRGDIIKTMHRAMDSDERGFDPSRFALHREAPKTSIVGRLVERGLQDELSGRAYAIVDGADGHVHHLRFEDLELTGDAVRGSIVECRQWEDSKGIPRLSLATRSDLPLGQQVTASGATWLDRQLVAQDAVPLGNGFGIAIRDALKARAARLETQGLMRKRAGKWVAKPGLIETLKSRDLAEAARRLSDRTGLDHRPTAEGEDISGIYRERVTLSSGRFAMIDDGLGFQLVPWRPALDRKLGQHVEGRLSQTGAIDWRLGRSKGIGL